MARLTWVFAVAGLTNSRSAISSFDSPPATSPITSRSRSVSVSRPRSDWGSFARAANSSISRLVMPGERSASPPATTRTACTSSSGSVSLTRNPLAPDRMASNTYSSRPNVVRITTRTPARRWSAAIRRVASSPSVPGIRMSINRTSGVSSEASRAASSPSAASPTTSMSDCASRSERNPARTRAWSSASRTRIVAPSPGGVEAPAPSGVLTLGAHP
jgi:hypothetical protein